MITEAGRAGSERIPERTAFVGGGRATETELGGSARARSQSSALCRKMHAIHITMRRQRETRPAQFKGKMAV